MRKAGASIMIHKNHAAPEPKKSGRGPPNTGRLGPQAPQALLQRFGSFGDPLLPRITAPVSRPCLCRRTEWAITVPLVAVTECPSNNLMRLADHSPIPKGPPKQQAERRQTRGDETSRRRPDPFAEHGMQHGWHSPLPQDLVDSLSTLPYGVPTVYHCRSPSLRETPAASASASASPPGQADLMMAKRVPPARV